MWGQALTVAGVSIESELRASNKVYCPPALCLAPSPTQLAADLNSAFASVQPTTTPAATPAIKKGQDQLPPLVVMDVESEEVAEVGQLKRTKKEKEKEKEK